jgi:hypothetical protein
MCKDLGRVCCRTGHGKSDCCKKECEPHRFYVLEELNERVCDVIVWTQRHTKSNKWLKTDRIKSGKEKEWKEKRVERKRSGNKKE